MSEIQPVLDALSSPVRREILWLIRDAELPAGRIAEAFAVSAPTISAHLAVLREAGLVTMRRDGNFRRYRADRQALRDVQGLLGPPDRKWVTTDRHRPGELAASQRAGAVVVSVDLSCRPATAFAGFTDPVTYSRWLDSEVTLVDGRFTCRLPTGRQVRGAYEVVAPPSLIAMHWDFDDGRVPVPGGELVAYLRIAPLGRGCRVTVHQIVDTDEQASFLEVAWHWVLESVAGSMARAGGARRRPRQGSAPPVSDR